jgi:hypothetical protein
MKANDAFAPMDLITQGRRLDWNRRGKDRK